MLLILHDAIQRMSAPLQPQTFIALVTVPTSTRLFDITRATHTRHWRDHATLLCLIGHCTPGSTSAADETAAGTGLLLTSACTRLHCVSDGAAEHSPPRLSAAAVKIPHHFDAVRVAAALAADVALLRKVQLAGGAA